MDEFKKPLQPGQNLEQKLLPFSERDQKMKGILLSLYSIKTPELIDKIQREITAQFFYLKEKYPDTWEQRIVVHILLGSTPPLNTTNTEEDFLGEDSVEKFMSYLDNKYLNHK